MTTPLFYPLPFYRIVVRNESDTSLVFRSGSFKDALKHSADFISDHLHDRDSSGLDLFYHSPNGRVVLCVQLFTPHSRGISS